MGIGADVTAKTYFGETALYLASSRGAVRSAGILLRRSKAELEERNNEGMTPLLQASKSGHAGVVQLLVNAGASINVVDGDTRLSPLHFAARRNNRELIQFLVEEGADIEARSRTMQPPLLVAVFFECYEAACVLGDLGADLYAKGANEITALHIAAMSGNSRMVSFLIERGSDIDAAADNGITPLGVAAEEGHGMVVSILLDRGANVEAGNDEKQRPLHFAARWGYLDVAEILLEHGAEPAPEDANRHTPEFLAIDNDGPQSLVELLQYSKPISKKTTQSSDRLVNKLVFAARVGDASQVARRIRDGVDINAMDLNGERAIIAAARLGHELVVELLVNEGAELDLQGASGESALWWASFYGHEGIVKKLLRLGARVDLVDGDGQTPLSAASQAGHTVIVDMLLKERADPNTTTVNGYPPLHLAAKRGYASVARLLLEAGADLHCTEGPKRKTAIFLAAERKHSEVVRLLRSREWQIPAASKSISQPDPPQSCKDEVTQKGCLEDGLFTLPAQELIDAASNGAVPKVLRLLRTGLSVHGSGDHIPLLAAAARGRHHAVQVLLKSGADPAVEDSKGRTALHHAAYRGHAPTIRRLCEAGTDINRQDNEGSSPLSVAARKGHEKAVSVILTLGARIETRDRDGRTPLWSAVHKSCMAVVEMLLDAGANINCADHKGHTPLSEAIERNNDKMTRLLLKKKALMRPIARTNMSPLCLAASQGSEGLVELLIDYGAELNHLSNNGETPLIKATKRGHNMVARILIEVGADTHLRDDDNRTALSYAKERGRQQIVSFICQAPSLRLQNERAMINAASEKLEHRLEYQYRRLSSGHIRLLHLQPGRAGDILSLEVTVADLSENPSFKALSYEWKGEGPIIPVQCGLYRVRVAPNCKQALVNLRSETETRVLWIDAVCINQKDKKEVNEQVAMMDQIYCKAEAVLMWIGAEDECTAAAFASFPILYQAVGELGKHQCRDIHDITLSDFNSCETTKPLVEKVLADEKAVCGLRDIYCTPYFSRSWILQEIILGSSRGVVVCGKQTCAWRTVKIAVYLFCQVCRLLDVPEQAELKDILDSVPIQIVATTDDIFAEKGKIELAYLLGLMDNFHASDPRDIVFATLRLASAETEGVEPPTADYTLSTQSVYVMATRYCIYHLEACDWALKPRSGKVVLNLPSWVPDYSTYTHTAGAQPENKDFSKVIRGHPATTTSESLYVDGCILDKVAVRVSVARKSDICDIVQTIVQALARLGRGLYDPSPGNLEPEVRTSMKGTYFEVILRGLFETDAEILEYFLNEKYHQEHTQDGGTFQDSDWESIKDDDEEGISTRHEALDVVSFIAWKLSVDDRTPHRSKNVPDYLKTQVGNWQAASRQSNGFDLAVYDRMESEMPDDGELFFTAKGHFGVAHRGEVEEGMWIALLDRTIDVCLLKSFSDGPGEGWYEFITRVRMIDLNGGVESLEAIDPSARIERLEIR